VVCSTCIFLTAGPGLRQCGLVHAILYFGADCQDFHRQRVRLFTRLRKEEHLRQGHFKRATLPAAPKPLVLRPAAVTAVAVAIAVAVATGLIIMGVFRTRLINGVQDDTYDIPSLQLLASFLSYGCRC